MTLLSTLWFVGCDKDEEKAVLNSNANVTTSVSPSSIVLSKADEAKTAITVAWETQNVNLQVASTYNIVFSYGSKEKEVSVTTSPKTFTVAELNKIALGELGMTAGQPADLKVSITQKIGESSLPNQEQVIKVTPYADLIEPTEWGVVGSLTGWGGSPDIPFWKIPNNDNEIVAYVVLPDDNTEFKFRKGGAWNGTYLGDDDTDGTLGKEDNINKKVKKFGAGAYRILFNEKALTYKMEKYSWGIVGGAANGWDESNTDIPLSYDGTIDSWVAKDVVLKDGEIKFRLNNKWGGDKGGATNALKGSLGGENITVTAGTYTITVNFTDETYSIVAQ